MTISLPKLHNSVFSRSLPRRSRSLILIWISQRDLSLVLLVIQQALRKVNCDESVSGVKLYISNLFAKYNLVVLALLAIIIGCALSFIVSDKFINALNIKNLIVGALIGLVGVQLILTKDNKVTIVDYFSILGIISLTIVIGFRGYALSLSNLILL